MIANFVFNVPAGAGAYAPEVLYLNVDNDKRSIMDLVGRLSVLLVNLIATVAVEVDLLKPGADPSLPGSWRLAMKSYNTLGIQALLELANWQGVRIRAKSGGTAGAQEIDAEWHRTAQ